MKKRFIVFLIVFSLSAFFYQPFYPAVIPVYANDNAVIKSTAKFIDAMEGYAADLISTFSLNISADLDVANIIEVSPLNNFLRIRASYEYYQDAATGKKVKANYYTYKFNVTYRDDLRTLRAFREPAYADTLSVGEKALLKKARDVIKEIITDGMSDYEKVWALHDYLILNAAYDTRAGDDLPEISRLAQGVLLNGKGVCSSYASNMCLLLGMLDIECIFVTGASKKATDHAWNKVKINGYWYNIDATWDDPTPDRPGEVSYTYFCLTDAELSKTHTWNKLNYPQIADQRDLNYYRYNKLAASNYSEFRSIISSAIKRQNNKDEIKIRLYVTNYNKKTFSFDFMYDIIKYNADISYTVLDTPEGEMFITITRK